MSSFSVPGFMASEHSSERGLFVLKTKLLHRLAPSLVFMKVKGGSNNSASPGYTEMSGMEAPREAPSTMIFRTVPASPSRNSQATVSADEVDMNAGSEPPGQY